ncbi:Nramp family divalent metal transporter [Scrofimicrobium sp. R131]|uniref:Divalent metal cation transporter MntH n=1 Tax=Scrofimicrobium appendicitidis TaxID=3079930 RepID=A0AAU7V6G5_9ACTO
MSGILRAANGRSLEEINSTIPMPPKDASFWRNLARFSGPGALVAVGYMDPGNWVTSIGGGSRYGYLLLSVVLLSSLVAMLLQHFSAKLGIVTGLDLAQATRLHTSKRMGVALWVVAELAIMATEVAEVLGSAIALHLLFGLPILVGVLLTVLDVLLLLLLLRIGFRKIEAIVATLILTIVLVFAYEVALANPDFAAIAAGFIPQAEVLEPGRLTMALGIIGATVMPHNLYLHSSIVQSRAVDRSDPGEVKRALRFATWDSNLQLGAAFFVNCLLLLLGAALFYGAGDDFSTFTAVYDALQNPSLSGAIASPVLSTLFAVALLASGQNATITGTLTGQIVMEGFLRVRLPMWLRRLITRTLAVIPVIILTVKYGGDEVMLDNIMIYSQVFLSLALPISMIPLVWFTSSRKIMGDAFANPRWAAIAGWIITAVLTALNFQLVLELLV